MSYNHKNFSRPGEKPSLYTVFKVFGRIGLLSFGGPAAQIALIHKEIVEQREWLTETQFLNALSFCMLLPGPEAMQLATYSGWHLHGKKGGILAGMLFVLPGSLLVLLLASIYATFGDVPIVQTIFIGVKTTVLIIVLSALINITKRALVETAHWFIASLAFIAFFFLSLPFPLVIFVAAISGFLIAYMRPSSFDSPKPLGLSESKLNFFQTLQTIGLWLTIWLVPLLFLYALLGWNNVFTQLGYFFSKLAVVTFGGAYSVLAYMAQEVVQNYSWLTAQEMLDGLGLAETTNGPLILVNEFVGYIAGYRFGNSNSFIFGFTGALVALWATFIPCFLWIFAGAPYVSALQNLPRLKSALDSVTAAVVGVILNLTVWFSLHVFFSRVEELNFGPLTIWSPNLSTIDWTSVGLAFTAAIALLFFRLNLIWVIFLNASLALSWYFVSLHLI